MTRTCRQAEPTLLHPTTLQRSYMKLHADFLQKVYASMPWQHIWQASLGGQREEQAILTPSHLYNIPEKLHEAACT